jgi:mono/diheme cytochrome c family protein
VTKNAPTRLTTVTWIVVVIVGITTELLQGSNPAGNSDLAVAYVQHVQPLLRKYCFKCHEAKVHKGGLDLERFTSLATIRKDLKPWQHLIEQVEGGEMPPGGKPQLTADERKTILTWVRATLDAEARTWAGDPGRVPLRRLSNAEYDCTIRDLTGVDLLPTREFSADGAAGEGFTNAAEALSDMTPPLFTRYLNAAKDIADHAVLLPDGFGFSPSKTRRDWTDEGTAALRRFYAARVSGDGKLAVQPYLLATVRHKAALAAGKIEEIAAKEKLNAKYLGVVWQALADTTPSHPLDAIREKWRTATEKDIAALSAEVTAWQTVLWKSVKVGNYVRESWGAPPGSGYTESLSRQAPVDPPALQSVSLRLGLKPAPGQSEVLLYLAAQEKPSAGAIVWHRPRFEAPGKPPLLLRDYADFGPAYERDYPSAFVGAAKYLAAAAEAANDPRATLDELAKRNGLDAAYLRQWAKVLAVEPRHNSASASARPAAPLTLLDEKTAPNNQHPAILGWKRSGTDLPIVVANSSDQTLNIPGRVSGGTVAVHPTPQEFVAVAWRSPLQGSVRVAARVAHAHPACGNGVAWWLEHRHGERVSLLGEGTLDLGKEAKPAAKSVQLEKGDLLVLAVDPRDGDHACDMTEVWLTITEENKPKRGWDLGKDISADAQAGNPHADKYGNADAWRFARGPAKPGPRAASIVPANSVLGRWRTAAADPNRQDQAKKLAQEAERMLIGPRPANEKDDNRLLYDRLVAADSPLFAGVDVTKIAKTRLPGAPFGLPKERFAKPDGDSLIVASDKIVEIRLPAALFAGREFVVDARLDGADKLRLVRVRAAAPPPDANTRLEGRLLGSADGPAFKQFLAGHAEFRRVFPLYICFPQVVPTDEVVTLKMFHREDEPLIRLFLTAEQTRTLDRMWHEQRFVSRQPVAEYDYLPQFMGFTTQDTPKAFQQFFIDRKPLFKKHAEEFLKLEEAAIPKQLEALGVFTEKAYRRPLEQTEKTDLHELYQKLRKKGLPHDEAFRGVLARVLTAPAFLFRIEKAPPGTKPGLIGDWELATRLSYFLWSSAPDDELRRLAAAGKLRDLKVLEAQMRRMLLDPRLRALAIEFGTQWIHVRNFDSLKEKNEKLFPTFTPAARKAIYEESILFFQDLFQSDRAVTNLLDADYTFLNETLAKHYDIPGVVGPQWRRVEGVRKYGRGGILGLASVQAKQSGASRTSPVLRGNWVVETLLGEKLPRPPANVPILPDQEGTDHLTTRQMVEQHVSNPSCAVCHMRIDPYGFAFENFDAIGRYRVKEGSGKPVDTRARLKDGTEFEGIDGLRTHLLTKRRDVIVRLFCRRLLGYALGRATALSDTALIDEMVAELERSNGRVSAAVLAIVRSPQFRMIRGRDVAVDN